MNVIKHIIKVFLIMLFIFISFCFSIHNLSTGASIFAVFAMFFLLMFYGYKFEIVEILGAKFKLKELNNSITELKELSKTVACISLDLLQRNGRWGTHNTELEKIDFFSKINTILDNVKITEKDKREIYDTYWHKWVLLDYAINIKKILSTAIKNSEKLEDNEKKELITLLESNNHLNTIKVYEIAMQKRVVLDSRIQEAINDLKYYMSNNRHKNINNWLKLNDEEQ